MKSSNHKTIKNMFKSFTCGILIGSICCSSNIFAIAASSAKGSKRYVNVNGVSFEMYNAIYTGKSNSNKYARAATDVSASMNLGQSYLGAKPIIYNASGSAEKYGTWMYSSDGSSGISPVVSLENISGSPAYFSWGEVQIWDGTDYRSYIPSKSPNLNDYT